MLGEPLHNLRLCTICGFSWIRSPCTQSLKVWHLMLGLLQGAVHGATLEEHSEASTAAEWQQGQSYVWPMLHHCPRAALITGLLLGAIPGVGYYL